VGIYGGSFAKSIRINEKYTNICLIKDITKRKEAKKP
jgi:hypothetical protein